jgi:hypothetical protein
MAITWSPDVQAIAPSDPAIQAFTDPGGVIVGLAYSMMSATSWGANLDGGARYLAAHLFTTGSRPGGYGGPTSDEKVGDVSRSSSVKVDDPQWDSTPYGRIFKMMLRNLQIESRWLVVGGPNSAAPSRGWYP